jgi:hypothetical protein
LLVIPRISRSPRGTRRRAPFLASLALAVGAATAGAAEPADAARLAPSGVAPAAAPEGPSGATRLEESPCDHLEIDYTLGAGTRVRISNTIMGAGDGEYDVGPGRVRLRLPATAGRPVAGPAELLALEVTLDFTVVSRVAGFETRATTKAKSALTPDGAGVVARGTFDGQRLTLKEPARGYRSRGTIHCEGALCGRFGAPPRGDSPVAVGPYPVELAPFALTDGARSLTLEYSQVAQDEHPRQTTALRVVGRESKRRCVALPAGH